MSGNSIGRRLVLTSFGESHGKCIGAVLDGCPAGLELEEKDIQKMLDLRKPGQSLVSTQRKEGDIVEILTGTFRGYTTGAPITMVIWNKDQKSIAYEKLRTEMRPGHSDYPAYMKYKKFNDHRGGGRFSGRLTATHVMGGAIARKLLKDISDIGLPTGTEFLDLISPQYISDLISWGAIGARTAESQVHRELTSGLSCPMGIKNSTNGDLQVAVDAMKSAKYQHVFLGTTKQGKVAIFKTSGNDDTHIILRGGEKPNYDVSDIEQCISTLAEEKTNMNLMVDFSHGNSQKNHENQKIVCKSIAEPVSYTHLTLPTKA